ncbi:MAG TPA: sigma-70 family RNA polymerase sigma factor [Thermoleophilaceae bacterium]
MAGVAAQLPRAKMPATALRVLGDDRLFRLAAAGDSRAFEVIYERHYQAIYRYCRSIVGNADDAADALQSTMASALRAIVGERREIPVRPWLFRIAHNESVSLLRKRRTHAAIDDALEVEAPAHDPAIKQRLTDLVADLRELPDAQRAALVMHELSGLPYREIGSALEVTEAHARQLVYEARTALHDLAEGRAMECDRVRRTISDGDRRVLRGRRIRSHLRTCSDCSSFEQVLHTRRRDLAAIAPPLPAAAALGLLHKILGGAASGGTGAAATSSGGAGFGSMLGGKALAVSGMSKFAAVVAITAAAGAGAVEVAKTTSGHSASNAAEPSGTPAHASTQRGSVVAPALSTAPISRRGGGAGGSNAAQRNAAGSHSGHGNAGATPVHPTHPAHPLHPAHPVHPTTPGGNSTHPTHPSHPVKPTHPSHPTTPTHPSHPNSPSGQQKSSSAPTHPEKSVLPTSPVQAPATTTPQVTGQGQVNGNANGKKDPLDLIP